MDAVARSRDDMILVIDDHPLACEALQMSLSEALGLARIETASSLGPHSGGVATGLRWIPTCSILTCPTWRGFTG